MWTKLKEYAALFEADLDRELLEEAGVEVQVKGPVTGIFGPGFSGATAQGVELFVHEHDQQRALELLGEAETVE